MHTEAIIAGLGNPGAEYADTRHNAGFRVLNGLAARWGIGWEGSARFRAEIGKRRWQGRTVWLCRPRTFMNLSGEAVGGLASYYQVAPDGVLVVVDDADLPLGTLRLRGEGSAGGHHGLESVEQHLGTRGYPRLRVGIGRLEKRPEGLTRHVLGRFDADERRLVERVVDRAVEQAECWWSEGLSAAMNRYNGIVPDDSESK